MSEDQIAEILKALAHPSRIKILQALKEDAKCVRELEEILKIKQSNLSQHLKILRNRGILECERKGIEVCYRIKNETVLEIIKCVDKLYRKEREGE